MAKTAADENFPVGSWLIARRLRPHVHAFYAFARAADDIADDPALPVEVKLEGLAALERQAEALPAPLRPHALELLTAFRADARGEAVDDWPALMDYCRWSAAPVGRMLLDLHGEDRGFYPASDALCAVLQVINHLQDCGDDARRLGRVYLPGASLEALRHPASSPELRRVFAEIIDRCRALLRQAEPLRRLRSRRLRAESVVILALADRLLARLAQADPLAGRVGLSGFDKLSALCKGVWA